MTAKYEWRDGSFGGVKADVAAGEIDRIQKRDGVCTPKALVDESRDEAAPLHDVFEWDDEAAAESYRVEQARSVIRSVVVTYEESKPREIAYLSVVSGDERGYVPTNAVAADPVMHDYAVKDAIRQLNGWVRRAEQIKGLAKLTKDVRRVISRHEKALAKPQPAACP
jgi:hypothetical protein